MDLMHPFRCFAHRARRDDKMSPRVNQVRRVWEYDGSGRWAAQTEPVIEKSVVRQINKRSSNAKRRRRDRQESQVY